jgi:hypothetical protein
MWICLIFGYQSVTRLPSQAESLSKRKARMTRFSSSMDKLARLLRDDDGSTTAIEPTVCSCLTTGSRKKKKKKERHHEQTL